LGVCVHRYLLLFALLYLLMKWQKIYPQSKRMTSVKCQLFRTPALPQGRILLPFTKKLCRFLPKGLPLNGCHVDPSLLGSRPSACRVARQVLLTCGIRNKAGLES